MKRIIPLLSAMVLGLAATQTSAHIAVPVPLAQAHDAQWVKAQYDRRDRGGRGGDNRGEDQRRGNEQPQRTYSIDEAINLVESRSGGRYVSGNRTGPSTFVIKVQVGPSIVSYRVDLANRSLSRM
ncbi:MAG: hypothetical protein QM645_01040 [Asticcacaulis sp.]